ncbi:MAG TPA: PH domain-containing protein [Candidatus Nanoarchaeia archaeon]|nr:PH domain-containing protein [Candidatus Nanoarchaeia archaeon]
MPPSDVQLEPGENVVTIVHRHIINYLPILIATVVVLALLSFAFGWVLANAGEVSKFFPVSVITMLIFVAAVIAILIALTGLVVFRRNILILTDLHIFCVLQAGLFGRTISKLTLDEIQDAEGRRKGVLATIFNYGTVEIETAGTAENFLFYYTPDPLGVANKIDVQHENFERAHTFERP